MVNTPPVAWVRPMCQFVLWVVNRRLYMARGVASKFSSPSPLSPTPPPPPPSSERRTNTTANEQVNMFAGGGKDSRRPFSPARSHGKTAYGQDARDSCVVFVGVMSPPLGPLVMSVWRIFFLLREGHQSDGLIWSLFLTLGNAKRTYCVWQHFLFHLQCLKFVYWSKKCESSPSL